MRILWIAAALAWATAPAQAQAPAPSAPPTQTRIAGVDVGRAFREFTLTREAMKGFNEERRTIVADSGTEKLSKLAAEVKKARQAARRNQSDKSAQLRALSEAELKQEEYRALEKALRESRSRRTADLNRRLVASTRRLLAQVCQAVAEVGRERGYDLVVDTSGHTNTGLPLILYSRHLPDLTNEVIARLNTPPASPTPAPPENPR